MDSTLIRRGVSAATLSEITEFAESIEHRPLDKLLAELPALAALSRAKFDLARQVIRRRARQLAPVDLQQLQAFAVEIAADSGGEAGQRIRSLFSKA